MRLLDKVRHEIRSRHYSYTTEKSYVQWVKHFILFYNKRHYQNIPWDHGMTWRVCETY